MVATLPKQEAKLGKRKAHRKSRQGCSCCRMRRIKCDEAKPACKKCTAFGVSCTYDRKAADIQMSFEGTGTMINFEAVPQPMKHVANHTFIDLEMAINFQYPVISADDYTLKMDSLSMKRLDRFFTRTALSIGTSLAGHVFQDRTMGIAFAHPYLMHTIQLITATHDRYITGAAGSRSTVEEVYHLSQAAALFNKKLSGPVRPDDRDALWATAGLLSQVAFAFVEASTPEEAWPLTPPNDSDLEWISMSENKMAVWKVAQPNRPDSIFHELSVLLEKGMSTCAPTEPVLENLPPFFSKVFDLDNASIAECCPYRPMVNLMSTIMPIICTRDNILQFISFGSHMGAEYKALLRAKDPRALLLLAYWYAKVANSVWWLDRRATIECQAICLYLERNHPQERDILELLKFPKEGMGMGTWQIYPTLSNVSM